MKNHLKTRDLEQLLAPGKPASPPEGLAERIKAEIPAEIIVATEPGKTLPFARPAAPSSWSRWRPLMLAASLVATLGVGLFAYRNLHQMPPLEPRQETAFKTDSQSPLTPPPPPPPAAKAMPRPDLSSAPAEVAQPVELPQDEVAKLEALGYLETRRADPKRQRDQDAREEKDREWGVDGVVVTDMSALGESPSATEPKVITVTAESPLMDQRKVSTGSPVPQAGREKIPTARDSAAKRINVGGNESGQQSQHPVSVKEVPPQEVEGGVVGGVSGGVAGGSPGGTIGGVPSNAAAAPEPMRAPIVVSAPPSTGGNAEPNDQPYGDVFFREYGENPFVDSDEDRLSTFGLDVDTGSYTVTRRYLTDGNLPPREAVRVEEFVNFFDYGDAPPREGDFALYAEGAETPFAHADRYRVVRFGIKGREVHAADRKPALLIFTIDVSGSMAQENRLGLVKKSLYLLLDELQPEDRVGLVVYGSEGRVLLEPTSDLAAIRRAIDQLVSEGSTNAEEGLRLAYQMAERSFRPGAINRILLCSDGVANVGLTGPESILKQIESATERGIELTTVGFGMGNYNDVLMEQLADKGDGNYAYVDDLEEARRIFVENLTGTLQTIASDAKVQVDFNPEVVARWRLVGYENRDIADRDFRNDTIDAGEIGAGHSVSAVYEIKLVPGASRHATAATLYLRYKSKASGAVVEQKTTLAAADLGRGWARARPSLKLASIVAQFGGMLKSSYWTREDDFADLFRRAQAVSAEFPGRVDVAELATLIGRASKLWQQAHPEPKQ